MRGLAIRLAVVSGLLIALATWTHARPMAARANAPDFTTRVPLTFANWIGRDAPPLDPDVARVLAADEYVHRYYGSRTTSDNRPAPVEMDIAYYARPQAGAAMHSPLNCLPGNGWQVIESRTAAVRVGDESWDVRRLIVSRKSHRIAMAYWFQNRGAIVAHEYRQRLRLLTNGLKGESTDAALVRVMARDTTAGRAAVEAFTRDLIARLNLAFR